MVLLVNRGDLRFEVVQQGILLFFQVFCNNPYFRKEKIHKAKRYLNQVFAFVNINYKFLQIVTQIKAVKYPVIK